MRNLSPLLVAFARTTDDPDLQETLYDSFATDSAIVVRQRRQLILALVANPHLSDRLRALFATAPQSYIRRAMLQRDDVTVDDALAMLKATETLSPQVAHLAVTWVCDPDGVLATYVLDTAPSVNLAYAALSTVCLPRHVRLRAAEYLAAQDLSASMQDTIAKVFGSDQTALVRLIAATKQRNLREDLARKLHHVDELPDTPTIKQLIAWLTAEPRPVEQVVDLFTAETRDRARIAILRNYPDPTGRLAAAARSLPDLPSTVLRAAAEAPELPAAARKLALVALAGHPDAPETAFWKLATPLARNDPAFAAALTFERTTHDAGAGKVNTFLNHARIEDLARVIARVVALPDDEFSPSHTPLVLAATLSPRVDPDLRTALLGRLENLAGGMPALGLLAAVDVARAGIAGDFGTLPVKSLMGCLHWWRGAPLGPLARFVLDTLTAAGAPTDRFALEALATIAEDNPGTVADLCGSFAAVWL